MRHQEQNERPSIAPVTHVWLVLVLLFCVVLASPTKVSAQVLPFWGRLEPGPYSVGYTILYELDHSRLWDVISDSTPQRDFARPIRTSVWYPALSDEHAAPMTFGDYVHDDAPSDYFERLRDMLEARLAGIFQDASPELYDSLQTLQLPAKAGLPPADGEFPLVMYASGGGASVPDNGALAAYLASHGYVVAAVPQLGSTADEELHRDIADQVETQARDIEFAMGVAFTLPSVNRRKIAVIGYSFGGSVAIKVAGRNPNIDAVVGLDASFASRQSTDLDIKKLRLPILSLYAGQQEVWAARSDRLVDSLHYATRFLGRVGNLVHADFSELRGMLIPARIPEALADEGLATAHRGYVAICQYVLNFLNGVIKGDSGGLAFAARSSADNNMPPGLVDLRRLSAADVPTEEDFLQILEWSGIERAEQILRDSESEYPQLDIVQERLFNQFGYGLLDRSRPALAVEVFQLNAAAHPHSANAFDSLGDALLLTGDTLRVFEALERAIELLPTDPNLSAEAKERMRRRITLTLRLLER